ncbi:MAG: YitT family protein, partial [Peptococcaceae bacterium]|nr:YitT family protein [Peptococcaceae bacterium]
MEVLEWTREHKIDEAKKMALALLGILAFCIGVNWFIVPIGLYNGGFVGIGQVVRTALIEYAHMDFGDIDIAGFIYFACNVPLFFLAYKSLGKMFFVKTVICVVVQTFLLSLLKSPEVPIIEDRLAACLIGGIIA